MEQIRRGQRLSISNLSGVSLTNHPFQILLTISGLSSDIDFSCFGVDSEQKLSDDRYMTFFNQPKSPCGSVAWSPVNKDTTGFHFVLPTLPQSIDRIIIAATIDGAQTMRYMTSGSLKIGFPNGQTVAEFNFNGTDFTEEKALIVGEIYRKDGDWRFSATGQGFNGGLDALVRYLGGEVNDTPTPPPTTIQESKLSLEKKVAKEAPKLIDLAKKATMSLEKKKLSNVIARVGLILDASGSMFSQYKDGKVQQIINRILPLAVHFDDNSELDVWAFSNSALALPSANLKNYADFINTAQKGWKSWGMMHTNNEPAVIEKVMNHYKGTDLPVFIIFISDGGIDKAGKIKKLLTEASKAPIFWQFVGIAGRNYGIFEDFDAMTGRTVDNCGFFAIDDLNSISEQELYDRLLNEFPSWISAAKAKGIIA